MFAYSRFLFSEFGNPLQRRYSGGIRVKNYYNNFIQNTGKEFDMKQEKCYYS